jgi:hypothetical protein
MKNIYICFLFFLLGKTIAAQEGTHNNISISTRDFSLNTIGVDENGREFEGKVAVKLEATYNMDAEKVTIKFIGENQDSFDLNYPLSFQYFAETFNGKIASRSNGKVPHYESDMDVFYWIVGVTDQLKPIVASGELLLQQGLITYSTDNPPSYEEREKIKLKITEDYLVKVMQIENYKKKKSLEGFKIICDTTDKVKQLIPYQFKLSELFGDQEHFFTTRDNIINLNTADLAIDTTYEKFDRYSMLIATYPDTVPPLLNFRVANELIKLNENKSKNTRTYVYIQKVVPNRDILFNLREKEDSLAYIKLQQVKKGYYAIEKVKFHFEKGFLERIQVYVKYGEYQKTQIFENSFPIGFTSVLNYKKFKDIRLYIRNASNDDNPRYVILSDVIQNYDNELDIATKDYSPADTAFTVSPAANPIVKLFKQKAIYIIEGKTFTDASGFNAKSPNGLVQIELSRRFNLKTNRYQVSNSKNFGFLTHMIAQVNFSKLENKLKGLPLKNEKIVENGLVISPSYATNMDFLRYENLSIRTETNIFLFDIPENKVTLYGDFGAKYGHTPVSDSLYKVDGSGNITATAIDLDAHNFTLYPKLWLEIFAERRYGFTAAYQLNYTMLFSNNYYKQVLSYSGKGSDLTTLSLNRASRWSHTIEMKARFDSNPKSNNGKIFAVARFNFQFRDVNTFYPQILLGYAFNIFK